MVASSEPKRAARDQATGVLSIVEGPVAAAYSRLDSGAV